MKKRTVIFAIIAVSAMCYANTALAYWIWTPETKKFVNPKMAPKDSPKEQFDWAMSFYSSKDYKRSAVEFEKITKYYEYSEYASKAQYYVGLSYENMEKFYTAFQGYQKAVDNFPHIENLDDIIAREFNIGKLYASKDNPKVLGADIMTSLDRAVEIFKKVVDNAPYGPLADEAQFNMGEALKRAERYEEAVQAFQKLVDDYPNSRFAEKGRFEVAECAYKASLKPAYDSTATDKAIQAFQDFSQANRDPSLSKEADKTIQRLRDKMAEKSLLTADFYEKQKHYRSAIVYYQDVVDRFPDCSYVDKAKAKIEELKKKMAGETGGGGEKKAWKPLNFPKPVKQPKSLAPAEEEAKSPKKGWKPFSFAKPAKEESPEAESASAPAPEKPKSSWKPFDFTSKPKTEETSEQAAPVAETAEEKPPKKAWKPLSFDKSEKKETVESTVTAEPESAPAPEKPKSSWKPLSFTSKPKAEEPVADKTVSSEATETPAGTLYVTQEEKTAKKAWTPLNFDKSEKKETIESSTASESTPALEKPKSAWKPFDFTGKSKTEGASKVWAPLNFSKPIKNKTKGQPR